MPHAPVRMMTPPSTASSSLADLKHAAAISPADAKAQARYGSALVEAGDTREGIQCLQRSITLNPHLTAAWHNLALAAEQAGWLDVELDARRHVVAAMPGLSGEWIKLGYVDLQLDRYAEAKKAFMRATAIQPVSSSTLVGLAASEFAEFHREAAIATLRRAIQVNPRSGAAYENLAAVLVEISRIPEAEDALRRAAAIESGSPSGRLALARLLASSPARAKQAEARRLLERLVAESDEAQLSDPMTQSAAHQLLGGLLQRQGDPAGAIDQLRRAIALDPNNIEAIGALGRRLAAQPAAAAEGQKLLAQYKKAQELRARLRDLKQRMESHPNEAQARLQYGQALLDQSSFGPAVWQLKESLRLHPGDRAARTMLNQALSGQGRDSAGEASR